MCRDGAGRVLLVADGLGRAMVPGGPLRHGEHPVDALQRWARDQVPEQLSVRRPLRVATEVARAETWRGGWQHRDMIVFDAQVGDAGGEHVRQGVQWATEGDLATLRLSPGTAAALGLASGTSQPGPRVVWSAVPGSSGRRRQRFAAYGHAMDPAGRVLLTLIATGFPGQGRWHLPGGGTDFGESAEAGLHREIEEETAQRGTIGELLTVSHRHQIRQNGRSVDWHGVRVVYAVRVGEPSAPQVLEQGGSTAQAGWFEVAQALELPLTEVAQEALVARPAPW